MGMKYLIILFLFISCEKNCDAEFDALKQQLANKQLEVRQMNISYEEKQHYYSQINKWYNKEYHELDKRCNGL